MCHTQFLVTQHLAIKLHQITEIHERKNIQNVSVEDIVKEMKDTFTGTTQMTANCSSLSVVASVPQSTVSELELKIRAFIDHNIENCEARSSSWTNM